MAEQAAVPGAVPADEHGVERRKEAYTMALYVTICLLAALSLIGERADAGHVDVLKVVWGTTLVLALAHWLAFRLSAKLVASGTVHRRDAELAVAQLLGALAVAVIATVPVLLLPATAELDAARLILSSFIAIMGFALARGSGAGRGRSVAYAIAILVVAATIAVVKNVLSGH